IHVSMTANPCHLFSDAVLFWALQVSLLLFALFAALRDWIAVRNARHSEATRQIIRGETSMGYFYATYAAISGLVAAICLSVDVAKDHCVLWVLVDTAAVAYVCLFNGWFRCNLVGLAIYLSGLQAYRRWKPWLFR